MFTANTIARAAGLTRQAAHDGLARIAPAGQVDSRGKMVAAWRFSDLPLNLQAAITRRAVKEGFANGEELLAKLPPPWTAPVPWERLPQPHRDKAALLQKALAPALALRCDPAATPGQIESAGIEDFKAAFGYPITPRHWHRLLHRTITRDAFEENWQRLELYLDDRAFAAPKAPREVLRKEYLHRALDGTISTLESRLKPTARDRQFLWDAVFRHYEQRTAALTDSPQGNRERRQFKASLLHYLCKAFPGQTLCATTDSLKRRFDEKLIVWRNHGRTPEALEDRRPVDSGRFRKPDFSEDEKKIKAESHHHDGNESLAVRKLRERGELSQAYLEYYPFDGRRNKSAVPRSVRDAITADVEMTLPLRHGPWRAKMAGPYIPRDWSGVQPGDWFNADDVTFNHYFKEQDRDGRWRITRGECLLMTDLKTGYPLEFSLIAGHYDGEHIRTLILRVHDKVGLPVRGFYFEQGVWASNLIKGDGRHSQPVPWRETENGLSRHGLNLTVRSATTPRAKPIEGIIRILQERMRSIPGFVGFNERKDDFEREQSLIGRAHRGDVAAIKQLPTAEEWRAKIRAVVDEFANDPQNGQMLQGQSPAEAFSESMRHRPLKRLVPEDRYILSTQQKRVMVRQEGISFKIRGKRLLYYNEHTGPLIGREAVAFYNLELPDLLTVWIPDGKKYFSVKRIELPAMDATPEQFAEVHRARKGHMAHARAIFGEVKHQRLSFIERETEHGEESKELGRFHNAQTAKGRAEKTARSVKLGKVGIRAAQLGINPAALTVRNPDETLDALERRKLYQSQMQAQAATAAPGETENRL